MAHKYKLHPHYVCFVNIVKPSINAGRVTHASPAGMYAHVADRGWESDADVIKDKLDPSECEDIASQLVTKLPGMDLRVNTKLYFLS